MIWLFSCFGNADEGTSAVWFQWKHTCDNDIIYIDNKDTFL